MTTLSPLSSVNFILQLEKIKYIRGNGAQPTEVLEEKFAFRGYNFIVKLCERRCCGERMEGRNLKGGVIKLLV
jgi:hypothetical protein